MWYFGNKENKKILSKKFDVVLHFAAYANNEESIKKPKKYLINNYYKAKTFLNLCHESGIQNYIYSSTAAVYGQQNQKVKESANVKPLSPYAKSKYKLEKYLFENNKKFNFIILRYFNVGGVEKKLRSGFNIKKKDGTAIRDYLHVSDLAKIHYNFSLKLLNKKYSDIFNCGYGKGISVQNMYNVFKFVSKKTLNVVYTNKRKKDISVSISNVSKLKKEINITFRKKILIDLAKSSTAWYKKQKKVF